MPRVAKAQVPQYTAEQLRQARELAARMLAPESLEAYVYATYPGHYDMAPHHRLIIDKLEAVDRGEVKRLMIFMPPRRGKSQLASVHYPAWYLGRKPDESIIAASHTAGLAYGFSRKVRRQIVGPSWPFPAVRVADDEGAVQQWGIAGHNGHYIAAGVGGAIAGKGGNLIIDDPIKSREQADSKVYRERAYSWYHSDAFTRLPPDGWIILIQCMVGGTPVLMADGTERPLRDVRVGDVIATYDAGQISTSIVTNWANQGSDCVFAIRAKSGKIVTANERHPFLVHRSGGSEWVRLKDLKAGDLLLRASTGESGEASPVGSRGATSQPDARATACRTTVSSDGQTVSGPRLQTRNPGDLPTFGTGMASTLRNTVRSSCSRMVGVPSAESFREPTFALIGAVSSASITTTRPVGCEDCSATIATSWSDTGRRQKPSFGPLSTYEIIPDEIVEIVPAGREDVFDIQVEGTENFFANGIVSHNTRWHEDDLAGRLLRDMAEGGDQWDILELREVAEEGDADPLGRKPGEVLWPGRFPLAATQVLRDTQAGVWFPLYQQRPQALSGGMFKREWLSNRYDPTVLPEFQMVVQTVDSAFSDDTSADWSTIATWGATLTHLYLLDIWRAQVAYPDLIAALRDNYAKWAHLSPWLWIENKASGQSAIQTLRRESSLPVMEYEVGSQSKPSRAQDVTPWFGAGRVLLPEGAPWLADWINEHATFPTGSNDDQVDTTSSAVKLLVRAVGVEGQREQPPAEEAA